MLRSLCTRQRWISARSPKTSFTPLCKVLARSNTTGIATSVLNPRSRRSARRERTTVLFSLVAVVMLALAALLFVTGDEPSSAVMITTTTLAAVAMGTQAAAARHIAVKDVTTVVVTSTITGLAADSPLGSGKASFRGGGTARRAIAVLLILLGAFAGAGMLLWHTGGGLLLAGVLIGLATAVGAWHARVHRAII